MSQALLENPIGAAVAVEGATFGRAAALGGALASLLGELAVVIEELTGEQYAQRPVGVMPSSIGAHVRHNLDHIASVLGDPTCPTIDYDHRSRGTAVETLPSAALAEISRLRVLLAGLDDATLDRPIELTFLPATDGPAIRLQSSLGREIAYVISHTIHHNALIAAMVRTLGGTPPERLGYAPSTLRHLRNKPCAR